MPSHHTADSGADPSPTMPLGVVQGARPDRLTESSFFQQFGRWLRETVGSKPESSLKEALEEVLEEHEDSAMAISVEERNLLRNMLTFGELKVSDVAIPRGDIVAVPDTLSLQEMASHVHEHRHTRIPVFSGSLDNVVGFVHIKDLFFCLSGVQPYDLQALMRPILFVPPSMKITDLLVKMRLAGSHMAIVVDEYGGTDGLVTMEDVFEEIVGEIQDEHDDDEELPSISWVSERALEADARVKIAELEEELQLDLFSDEEEEDFDTIGGMIFFHLGRVPSKGEVVAMQGIRLEILAADPRRIKKVRVMRA